MCRQFLDFEIILEKSRGRFIFGYAYLVVIVAVIFFIGYYCLSFMIIRRYMGFPVISWNILVLCGAPARIKMATGIEDSYSLLWWLGTVDFFSD